MERVDSIRLGAMVRHGRQRKGLRQSDVARLVGIPASKVTVIEMGAFRYMLSPEEVVKFSEVIEVPVYDLVLAAGYPVDNSFGWAGEMREESQEEEPRQEEGDDEL